MYWQEILTAVALVLVIEGLLPFIGPGKYRELVVQIAQLGDNQIRTFGLTSMIAGLVLLYFVR